MPRLPSERTTCVALLQQKGRFLVAKPFFEKGSKAVVERVPGIRVGQLALVEYHARKRAKIVRALGKPEVATDVIEALLQDRGLRAKFKPKVEREVATQVPVAVASRRDLRGLPTFTVDPATAKDFDDAISAEEFEPGHWRVWVHIADVAAYVRPGSHVDREAYRRATSVYVPGMVEPMLPPYLSNNLCSLVPGADRLAVTVELEIQGCEVANVEFYRSLIHSDARLSYDQVDAVFVGRAKATDPWARPLAAARAAAQALAKNRARAGALVLEAYESEFGFNAAGHVEEAWRKEQTEAHRLIEHLMVAANEQVALLLDQKRVPTLYRVHESPDPERVEFLVQRLESLAVPTPPLPGHLTPTQAADLVGEISATVDRHVRQQGYGRAALTATILRTLMQAHYATRNFGHSGLQLSHYCHFTSPIRRYPDLVCHRALLAAIGAGEDAPTASGLTDAATWTSEREREALRAERDATGIAHCFLLERELFEHGYDQEFEGEVVGLIRQGAFVAFGAAYEGFLPMRRLPGRDWQVNELATMLCHPSGGILRLGDGVKVRVKRVRTARGRIELALA